MTEKKYDKERVAPRYDIPTLVDLEFEDGTYRHEFSVNISKYGMLIETDKVLPVGTMTVMRFAIPNLDWVFEIKAKVVWAFTVTMNEKLDRKKDSMGFSFTRISDEDLGKLTTYLTNFKIEDLEL